MDPFNEYTTRFCRELRDENLSLSICKNSRKWFLLACDIVLKEKGLNFSVYNKTISSLYSNIHDDLTETEWIFVLDCTRKAVKRLQDHLNSDITNIIKLLEFINNFSTKFECKNNFLKLILACKDYKIGFAWDPLLISALYEKFEDPIEQLKSDEYIFTYCKDSSLVTRQQCERLLILLDPLRLERSNEYLFNLFSFSDSQLIQFMKRLFKANQELFFEFYDYAIYNELISVDFFIDQLLTDSIDILELLLAIFGANPKLKLQETSFKNFHTLLLLKLEIGMDEFPFDCKILIKKLNYFTNKE